MIRIILRPLPYLSLALLMALVAGLAQARSPVSPPAEIRLQLNAPPQFQFAGYYAAQAQGYYRDAGLTVTILPGSPAHDPVTRVLAGEAEFGIGASELLLAHSHGQPLVALAAIIQHSPRVLLARKDQPIGSLHDLLGKKIQVLAHEHELYAMFEQLGYRPIDFELLPRTNHLAPLLHGEVDAITADATLEPYELDQHGMDYLVITPRSAGIDFYGGTLFTRHALSARHPALVEAFRRASLRGWEYALQYPQQIVELLLLHHPTGKSREHLLFEARELHRLMVPELVELGHMSRLRWQQIASSYERLGLLGSEMALDRFLYSPAPPPAPPWQGWLNIILLLLALLLGSVITYIMRLNHRLRLSEVRYRLLYQSSPLAIIAWDRQHRINAWNPRAEAIFGWPADEVIGEDIFDVLIPLDEAENAQKMLTRLQQRQRVHALGWSQTRNGERIRCEWMISLQHDRQRRITGATALAIDVTERQRIEQALQESEQRYRLLAENAFDVIWTMDMAGHFTYVSPSVTRLRGYSVEEVMRQPLAEALTAESRQEIERAFAHLQQTGELLQHSWELDQPCKDGSIVHTEVIINLLYDEQGRAQEILGITRDITERKLLERELRSMAHYDSLTGLPNRSLFFDRLQQAIKLAHRQQQCFALLFIDLDGFKEANDRFGHDFGDEVLREVARRLKSHVRQSDTVARMGGDEFTVILNDLKPDDRAEPAIEAILRNLAQPYPIDGHVAILSASIGISRYPADGERRELLLKRADSAMYAIKHSGKNGYAYYQPEGGEETR